MKWRTHLSTSKADVARAAPPRRAAFEVGRSGELELELVRRFGICRIVGRVARSGDGRRVGRQAEMAEDLRVAGRKRIDQRRAAETAAVTYNPLGASAVAVMANRFGNAVH